MTTSIPAVSNSAPPFGGRFSRLFGRFCLKIGLALVNKYKSKAIPRKTGDNNSNAIPEIVKSIKFLIMLLYTE